MSSSLTYLTQTPTFGCKIVQYYIETNTSNISIPSISTMAHWVGIVIAQNLLNTNHLRHAYITTQEDCKYALCTFITIWDTMSPSCLVIALVMAITQVLLLHSQWWVSQNYTKFFSLDLLHITRRPKLMEVTILGSSTLFLVDLWHPLPLTAAYTPAQITTLKKKKLHLQQSTYNIS